MEETLSDVELSATIRKLEEDFKKQMISLDLSYSAQQIVTAESILAEIRESTKYFAEAIANLDDPNNISEKDKQELFRSHRKWGELGWTYFLCETLNFYDTPPTDANDAYEKVKIYCSPRGMELLFDDLRKENIRKSDLDSAIFCFQNRQYKACTLLLFGIIESKLICKMPKPHETGKHRPGGGSAVKILKRQNKNENSLFLMLHGANLFSCLETFFANGNDFKNEPLVINRNFVAHGMNKREVRRRDCVQLFLALYNFTRFLKLYKSKE